MFFVDRPMVNDKPNPTCTTSRVAPALDVVLSLVAAGTTAYAWNQKNLDSRNALVAGSGIWMLVHAGSAGYGFRYTSECIEGKSKDWPQPDPDERAQRQKRTKLTTPGSDAP